jgi:hypothetical protein
MSLCFNWGPLHEGILGSRDITPHILNFGTRWRWVVSFTLRTLYPQGYSPYYPLDRRMGGRSGEEKNSHIIWFGGQDVTLWIRYLIHKYNVQLYFPKKRPYRSALQWQKPPSELLLTWAASTVTVNYWWAMPHLTTKLWLATSAYESHTCFRNSWTWPLTQKKLIVSRGGTVTEHEQQVSL